MTALLKIVIVGGYGTFGGRLVELLEDEPRLALVVAGRSAERASRYCLTRTKARAQLLPIAFDRNGDIAAQLDSIRPDILVDASGPFQAYGEAPYRLIEHCIARRVHYMDLADGSDFVAGVFAFDAAAREAGVSVLSGVSSFPVLTAAVVRRLSSDMARVTAIRGGVAPSPYAGLGENVIRAIASYAGQRTPLKRDGKIETGYPITECTRFTIAPPGVAPLKSRLFSLVDVPDLHVLADLWPNAREIWMGAGPVPEVLHRILIACAWLVRLRLVPSLSPLARFMHLVTNRLRWGAHRGGMFVEVEGEAANGIPLKRQWHLLAEGDDGPFIPSMALEALIRKRLEGRIPAFGARAAVRDIELEDYEALFAHRAIDSGIRDDASNRNAPLYERILGTAWHRLPIEIRTMHALGEGASAEGRAWIERDRGILANAIASVVGFPRPGADVPIAVRFDAKADRETWTRTFAGHSLSSRQSAGRGMSERLLCETFGPFTFAMALIVEREHLRLVLHRWSVFGIPLPLCLGPRSNAYETVEDGRFRFHVEIGHPLIGLIVRYRGWLTPVGSRSTEDPSSRLAA